MGEKRDSGSKDADNFGAEFGTDRRLEQRQAATRRNQAVQTRRSSAGDDRASGTSRGTVPTGGVPAAATLNATTLNTTSVPNVNSPSISVPQADPSMVASSLGQDLSRSLDNVIFGDEFGGNLRPRLTTLNVSPILASTGRAFFLLL